MPQISIDSTTGEEAQDTRPRRRAGVTASTTRRGGQGRPWRWRGRKSCNSSFANFQLFRFPVWQKRSSFQSCPTL